MKMTSKAVVSWVSALALVAAWLPASANAADGEHKAPQANICSAATAEQGSQTGAPESQPQRAEDPRAESGWGSGYCTLDCSSCTTNADCWSRKAGNCTSIPACFQSEPLLTVK